METDSFLDTTEYSDVFQITVTLSNDISLEVVSKMMGHTNTRMTSHYAKIVDKCISGQMAGLMDRYGAIV